MTEEQEEKLTAAEAEKIRGRDAYSLIGDLAQGDLTHEGLGVKYGRKTKTISNFSSRNRAQIEERKRQIGNQLVGMWIADKAQRIVTYQDQAEKLEGHQRAMVEAADAMGDQVDTDKFGRLTDRIAKCMLSVAEELGHLPTRNPGDGPAVVHLRHNVNGLDIAKDWLGVPDDASELLR